MNINLALQNEQEQRIKQDLIALEYKRHAESLEAIAHEAKEWGKQGNFPQDPNSEIYFRAWCEGYREFALATLEIMENAKWGEVF